MRSKTCSIEDTVGLMAEVQEEAAHAAHHKKKIAFVFSAMMRSARELKAGGLARHYVKLDDPANSGSLTGEVKRASARRQPERVVLEWRILQVAQTREEACAHHIRRLMVTGNFALLAGCRSVRSPRMVSRRL